MAAQKHEASSTKKGKTRNPKIKNNCIWQGQLVDQNQGNSAQEREKDRSFRGCKGDYTFCKGIQGQNSLLTCSKQKDSAKGCQRFTTQNYL